MTTMPAAAGTVTVTAPAPSPGKSASSTPAATTPSPQASPASLPALAPPPVLASVPATPAMSSTSPISPVSVASVLPAITPPPAAPAVASPASPVADSGTPTAGDVTVVIGMSATTAQVLGFGGLGLVFLLAATKIVGDQRTARRNRRKPAAAGTGNSKDAGNKRLGFRFPIRLARPGRRPAAPRSGDQLVEETSTASSGDPLPETGVGADRS
jgi:hypothetical protein